MTFARSAALATGVALLLATGGCGNRADDVISATASNLGKVHSGNLRMSELVSGSGSAAGEQAGFELHGPFSLGKPGSLPLARIAYTQIAGKQRATTTLVSDGKRVFAESGAGRTELPPSQRSKLIGSVGSDGVSGLPIRKWFDGPKASDGPSIDGAATDRVVAKLNSAEALNSLVRLAGGAQTGLPQLEGRSAEQIDRAVERSSIEILSGRDDHLLRKLVVDVSFGLGKSQRARQLAGPIGARLHLDLSITGVNEPVSIR
ncbi:MAG: hypothetical protein QOG09_1300 [Solirubrobacterales bacterium]|jgi:hypothetical protein|nr:hypothetical protein [Solirubrobacterales bacterium]